MPSEDRRIVLRISCEPDGLPFASYVSSVDTAMYWALPVGTHVPKLGVLRTDGPLASVKVPPTWKTTSAQMGGAPVAAFEAQSSSVTSASQAPARPGSGGPFVGCIDAQPDRTIAATNAIQSDDMGGFDVV